MWKFLDPIGQSVTVLGIDLGVCVIIYIINCVFVSRRPEVDMEFGSTKRNRRLVSGLPTNNPLFYFWDC